MIYRHLPDSDFQTAVLLAPEADDRRRRNNAAMSLLDEWAADESGYDEETWPSLKEALDDERRRIGARLLFRE